MSKWKSAKRRNKYSLHFGDDNIIVDKFIFNNVHTIPEKWKENDEVDFYLDTGNDICLLRLRNTNKNQITFCGGEIIYIIAEKKVESDILTELKAIVKGLKLMGIPDSDVLKGQKTIPYKYE